MEAECHGEVEVVVEVEVELDSEGQAHAADAVEDDAEAGPAGWHGEAKTADKKEDKVTSVVSRGEEAILA